jgi:hypothetical protein
MKFKPVTDEDMMTLKYFAECVASGAFIDYDGYGEWARENEISDLSVYPSDVVDQDINRVAPIWATHVAWYNR